MKYIVNIVAIWVVLCTTQSIFALDQISAGMLAEIQKSNGVCLKCHAETKQVLKFSDGTIKYLNIDPSFFATSVHGAKLYCTDCHSDHNQYPHPKKTATNERDYTLQSANICQRCHYAHYTKALDSTHYEMLKQGSKAAPTCVDCHGSHGIKNPKSPRTEINKSCGKCHKEINSSYISSIHGKALIEENNQDVPACTDCHGAHAVVGPNQTSFHENAYKICASCHSNTEKMKKYGLNPEVAETYLDDFHGSSNRLYTMGAGEPGKPIATCYDCHGVHDIQSFKKMDDGHGAKKAAREQIIKSCRKCHEGVPPQFADAWLSHYKATFENAPLVWIVKWFYRFLIPLIMLGLVLHILLHLWQLKRRK